jgi:hypothetical protein
MLFLWGCKTVGPSGPSLFGFGSSTCTVATPVCSLPYHDPAPDGTARAQHAFLGGGGRVQGLDVVRSQTRDVGNSPALREGGRPAT